MDKSITYIPRSNVAEWHITYRCNLSCTNCNRLCFLPPTTPDMTLEDAREFVRQAKAINWTPKIVIIGGEPTLHKDFFEILVIAGEVSHCVELWSNGYSPDTKRKLEHVRTANLAIIVEGTQKLNGSIAHDVIDYFIAPIDFGEERQRSCEYHSHAGQCGISVDNGGYTVCPVGGAIDGMLTTKLRTRNLADLFNPIFARCQTYALCSLCGHERPITDEHITKSRVVCGSLMSPTWYLATQRTHNR